MKATVLDMRYRAKELLEAVDAGKSITITSRGKVRAKLSPAVESPRRKVKDAAGVGMWKDREDMADSAAYVRRMRTPRFHGL